MPAIKAPAWPMQLDNFFTQTSEDQVDTEAAINELFSQLRPSRFDFSDRKPEQPLTNPWLPPSEQSSSTIPAPSLVLDRQAHTSFLTKLLEPLPGAYTAFDTNRSWLLYWILHSFDLLAVGLDGKGRARAVATLVGFQNKQGGFGGGPDQIAHLMATYAAVSALAIIGGPGPAPSAEDIEAGESVEIGKGGWDEIDKKGMYEWIMRLKQPDGSFLVHVNGEVDVRAGYCVVCVATLLGIATPELLSGMVEFVASCQTYEGGIAAASQPTYSAQEGSISLLSQDLPRPPMGEAHGGYTYCAAASHLALSLLSPSPSPPNASLNRDSLIRWATAQQGTPFEGCGFRGRTNKLVDGCYGWFSGGGLFTVLSAMVESDLLSRKALVEDFNGMLTVPPVPTIFAPLSSPGQESNSWKTDSTGRNSSDSNPDDEDLDVSPLTLFDRTGLQEYILVAAQRPSSQGGGLRDKPGKRPDAYHTCYNLSGLSLSQHSVRLSSETKDYLLRNYKGEDEWRKNVYATMLSWTLSARDEVVVGGEANRLNPTHPIYNVTFPRVKTFMDWAYGQA